MQQWGAWPPCQPSEKHVCGKQHVLWPRTKVLLQAVDWGPPIWRQPLELGEC